eukprot:g5873.t1
MVGNKCELPLYIENLFMVAWGDPDRGGSLPPSIASLKNIKTICSTEYAFAALTNENSVVAWGDPDRGGSLPTSIASLKNIKTIFSTYSAFAALTNENSVVAWGHSELGADVPTEIASLKTIKVIFSNGQAFAALTNESSVVAWGHSSYGADVPTEVASLKNIKTIFSTAYAFAALTNESSVVAWGSKSFQKKNMIVPPEIASLKNIKTLFSSRYGFAALTDEGSVVAWGLSSVAKELIVPTEISSLKNIKTIFSAEAAFAALTNENSVVAWGDDRYGGSLPPEIASLKNIKTIFSTWGAFAALTNENSVVAWGYSGSDASYAADVPTEIASLKNIKTILSIRTAFAALTNESSVVAWGHSDYGGSLPPEIASLKNIKTIFSTDSAFAALTNESRVVAWGDDRYGGSLDWGGSVSPSLANANEHQNVLTIAASNFYTFVALKGLCPFGTFFNNTFCEYCPQGLWSTENRSTCNGCTPGKYQVNGIAEECANCTAGMYITSHGSTSCKPCALGNFQNENGQPLCSKCPQGKFTNRTGSIQCHDCPLGRRNHAHKGAISKDECIICPKGRYTPITSSPTCDVCVAGRFNTNDDLEKDSCIACPIGRYNSDDGLDVSLHDRPCLICPAGAYNDEIAQATCSSCTEGRYLADASLPPIDETKHDDLSDCLLCAIGTFNPVLGSTSSSACQVCGAGKFNDAMGQQQCTDCPEGRYLQDDGSASEFHTKSSCLQCIEGQYTTHGGAAECIPCAIGKYAVYNFTLNNTICVPCSPGTFNNALGRTNCTTCNSGETSESGATVCFSCAIGKFLNNSKCLQCDAGYRCPRGAFEPVECLAGTYAEANSPDCLTCELGKYSRKGARNCTECLPGHRCPRGAFEPVECFGGTYAEANSPDCLTCELGKYSRKGAGNCTECLPGHKCPRGVPKPIPCLAGTYAPSNSPDCLPCDLGAYASKNKSSSCNACPRGTYQDAKGSSTCIQCPLNTFNPLNASTALSQCKKCDTEYAPHTATLRTGAVSENECVCKGEEMTVNLGFFHNPSPSTDICLGCPVGGKCKNANTTVSIIETLQGFWRSHDKSTSFHSCLSTNHCPGTQNRSVSKHGVDSQCATGHTATLCAACLKGYKMVQEMCNQCDEDFTYMPWLIFYFITYVVFVLYMKCVVKRQKDPDAKEMAEQADTVSEMVGTGKILISFLQIFTSLQLTMDIPWSISFKQMMDFFRIITIDLSDIFATFNVCSFITDFSSSFYSYMALLPALSAIAFLAAWTLILCDAENKRGYFQCAIKIIFTVMFLLYPSIGGKVFSVFRCLLVGDTHYFLNSMEMKCFVGQHAALINLSFVFVALYVLGIPIYIYFVLHKNKTNLKRQDTRELYGQLYMQYEEKYWYWEIIEMLRKVFLCGGLLTVAAGTSFQIVVALLVQVFYIVTISRLMPYKHFHDDIVQLIGSMQLFLTLIAGLMLKLLEYNTKENISSEEQENLSILLIAINCIIFFACACAVFLATPYGKKTLYNKVKSIDKTKITPVTLPTSKAEKAWRVEDMVKSDEGKQNNELQPHVHEDWATLNQKYNKEYPEGTPIFGACAMGRLEDVEGLIHGASVSGMDVKALVNGVGNANSACLFAAYDQVDIVDCLLKHGADASIICSHGYNALHAAAWLCKINTKTVQVLLKNMALKDINQGDKDGYTPLDYCYYYNNSSIKQDLIALIKSKGGRRASDLKLLEDWNFLNGEYKKEFKKRTPLEVACEKGRMDDVILFIRGARVAGKDIVNDIIPGGWLSTYQTPLMTAARYGHSSIVATLIDKYGADPTITNREGNNALHIAAQFESMHTVGLLLSKMTQKDINHKNRFGYTPLDCCLHNSCLSNSSSRYKLISLIRRNGGKKSDEIV